MPASAVLLVFLLSCQKYIEAAQDYSSSYSITSHQLEESPVLCSIPYQNNCLSKGELPVEKPIEHSKGYSYVDDNGIKKIALNFSWGPQLVSSIEDIRGYEIKIFKRGKNYRPLPYSLCCNLSTRLDLDQHHNITFYYDGYGRKDIKIEPGDSFVIQIGSIPGAAKSYLKMNISLPDCNNAQMSEMKECSTKPLILVSINKKDCNNNSILVSYFVSDEYGRTAKVLLKQLDSYKDIDMQVDLPLNYSLWLNLPDEYSLNDNYSVIIWGSGSQESRNSKEFSFASCAVKVTSVNKLQNISIFLPVLVTVFGLALILSIICITYKVCTNKKLEATNFLLEELSQANTVGLTAGSTIYIVYADDHGVQKDVLLNFTNYLMQNHGFTVLMDKLDVEESFPSLIDWIEKSMDKADTVMVVWSDEAKARWDKRDNSNRLNDMFTSVINKILNHVWHKKNIGKYIFVSFELGGDTYVPQAFKDFHMKCYILMEEFQKIYHKIEEVEQSYLNQSITKMRETMSGRFQYDGSEDLFDIESVL